VSASAIQAPFNVKLSNVDMQQYIVRKLKWDYIYIEFKKGQISRKKYFFTFRFDDDK
jgi:hypothetical protein